MQTICTALGALSGILLLTIPALADPLMGNRGWQPRQESTRGSIAALMLQNRSLNNQVPSYAGALFTCGGPSGGPSTSTSTANSNCTIVVDSHGNFIGSDQTNNGNQTADSDSTVTTNGLTETSLSSILESMN